MLHIIQYLIYFDPVSFFFFVSFQVLYTFPTIILCYFNLYLPFSNFNCHATFSFWFIVFFSFKFFFCIYLNISRFILIFTSLKVLYNLENINSTYSISLISFIYLFIFKKVSITKEDTCNILARDKARWSKNHILFIMIITCFL